MFKTWNMRHILGTQWMRPSPGISLHDSQEYPPASYKDILLYPLPWHSHVSLTVNSCVGMVASCFLFFFPISSSLRCPFSAFSSLENVLDRQGCDLGCLRSKVLPAMIMEVTGHSQVQRGQCQGPSWAGEFMVSGRETRVRTQGRGLKWWGRGEKAGKWQAWSLWFVRIN